MAADRKSRKPIDWERIEQEYRAGQLSVCEIGRQHGLTEGAIRKRAKRDGWQRDLTERVKDEVRARLVREEPEANQDDSAEKSEAGATRDDESTKAAREASEAEAVDRAARRAVQIVREHRQDIGEQRDLVRTLYRELRDESDPERLNELQETVAAEKDGRRRAALQRAISLPARAGVMRDLATAGKVLIELERQAFSLDEPKKSASPIPESVRELSDDELAAIAAGGGAGTSDPAQGT